MVNPNPSQVARSPLRGMSARSIGLLLLVFAVVWLVALEYTSLTEPLDSLEQLIWLRSLEWGYYKHPPFVTWLAWVPAQVFGATPALSAAMGGVVTMAAVWVFWFVLRDMRGGVYATIAVLAALCVTFYNLRLNYYNHNVVLLFWYTVAAALTWRLTRHPSLRLWLAMGVVGGLGVLSKYQIAVAGLSVGLWWLHMRWWREPVHRWGAALAVLLTLLIASPHLVWLVQNDWLPIRYAEHKSLAVDMPWSARPWHALNWALDWVFNRCLPAWLLLALAAWLARKRVAKPDPAAAPSPQADDDRVKRAFLLLWGCLPLVFMVLLAIFMGIDLQMHWGTAFALWTVPVGMELFSRRGFWRAESTLRMAWPVFVGLQCVLLIQHLATSAVGIKAVSDEHWSHFPSAAVAAALSGPARQALGGPIDIISGPYQMAAPVALQLPEQPRVLIQGNLRYSPWIRRDELAHARIIEVFPTQTLPPGAHWAARGWAWQPGISTRSGSQTGDRPKALFRPPDESARASGAGQ